LNHGIGVGRDGDEGAQGGDDANNHMSLVNEYKNDKSRIMVDLTPNNQILDSS